MDASGERQTHLPEGRLALLFTDISGSTALLHDLGDDYGDLLDAHDVLMREIWEEFGGIEVDNEGDAFFVVFTDHEVAADAAEAVVRRCAERPWPRGAKLELRLGLHSGEPRVRGRHYWGVDVHYAARLCAAAQGGQVLLSAAMRAELATREVESLGAHGLKDFPVPRELFHLVVDASHAADFEPPRTLSAAVRNIPSISTPIIGRDQEVSRICGHLLTGRDRVVTLVGSGGLGKTRTVIACAEQLADALPGGVAFISLDAADDVESALQLISDGVGAPRSDGSNLLDTLTTHLLGRQLLLVIDNTEHLPDLGPVVAEMLRRLELLVVLVASQAPLGVRDEVLERLGPLPIPMGTSASAADLENNAAVAMLVDRVHSHDPSFAVTPANAEALAQLCRELEGVPLALELAAARVPALGVEQLLKMLERDPDALGSGPADLPPRQRGLRAALQWTVSLLSARDRSIFTGLGVFGTAWTLEQAEQLFADLDPAYVWDALTRLRDLSLVSTRGDGRFTMPERVQRHATELLAAGGDENTMRRRHVALMAARMEQLGQTLILDWVPAIADVVEESEEVLHALAWARANDAEALRELVAEATLPLNQVGRLPALFDDIAVLAEDIREDRITGLMLLAKAAVEGMGGEDSEAAVELARRALPLLREHGLAWDRLRAIMLMSNHLISLGDSDAMPPLIAEARTIAAGMADPRWMLPVDEMELAYEIAAGELDRAEKHLDAMDALPGMPEHAAIDHETMRGDIAFQRGDYTEAAQHYAETVLRMGAQDLENVLYQVQGIAASLAALGRDAEATELLVGSQIVFGARTGRSLELILPAYAAPLDALRIRYTGDEAQGAAERGAALKYDALRQRALALAAELSTTGNQPGG